jgi:hypothetical protein
MEAILEENPATLVIAGNGGNSGNSTSISRTGMAFDGIGLYPTVVSDTGNEWEQTDLSINTTIFDDLQVIPPRYQVLKIDGETAPLSGQWIYRNSQGKFFVLCAAV